ncbi:MAG: MBL fold metallo-hydrolase [Anaerolineae bacterium]|nr:MBL fold metallo-hydrolase [Anaerolineae bacterium]
MHIHFLRHATLVLTYHNVKLLVDPMLSPVGALDPVANAADQRRIPLVDLPISDAELRQLIDQSDAVLVTHTHRDHWDTKAIELIPKDKLILCQPASQSAIREAGFTAVTPFVGSYEWHGITFHRTGGQHGTGEIGQKMGIVSGFVLQAPYEPILYIAGDTIWCDDVQHALETYHPDAVIVNAGAAQFLTGDPITMTAADVGQVCRAAPSATVVAVHMETVNHCGLTRTALRSYLESEGLTNRVMIPADGADIAIAKG